MKLSLLSLLMLLASFTTYAQEADLATLSKAGQIIGPGNRMYPVGKGWTQSFELMKTISIWDDVVRRIERVACGKEQNKSVLLVGDATTAYRYIFSKIAVRSENSISPCKGIQHVDIDTNKIEAGNKYVGMVDEYWNNNIYTPSANKNVVIYFKNLDQLIGLGSHSQDSTGIEAEYVSGIQNGSLRTVAYMDKYQYNTLVGSENAYVAHAFAEMITIPPVDVKVMDEFIMTYLSVLYPNLTLSKTEAEYFYKAIAYYQPNRSEPERSIAVLDAMIRTVAGGVKEKINTLNFETDHPYKDNLKWEKKIEIPGAEKLVLVFSRFDTEKMDMLEVYDNNTGRLLDTFSGRLGAFETNAYSTNSLKVVFKSDAQNNAYGITLYSVKDLKTFTKYTFTHEDVRTAVLTAAQVPRWLMDRNYSMIKDLPAKLDGDVVGVSEGKADAIRLIKNGYITGRTDEKPVGTMLLAGPTGTGKSYLPKRLADFLNMNLITLDMTSYKDPYAISQFVKTLSKHLVNNPYAIFLFEEIDKASIEVLDQLYFMMDEGIFYDPYQRPISARGAFIIMTTNAAQDVIIREKSNPNLQKLVAAELQKFFRPSFINRFDAVSIFYPFTEAEYLQLAGIMAKKKIDGMKKFLDWEVTADQGTVEYIAKYGKSAIYGARPMERLVETVLGFGMAEYQVMKDAIPEGAKIAITKTTKSEHSFQLTVNKGAAFDFEIVIKPSSSFTPYSSEYMKKFYNFFDRIAEF